MGREIGARGGEATPAPPGRERSDAPLVAVPGAPSVSIPPEAKATLRGACPSRLGSARPSIPMSYGGGQGSKGPGVIPRALQSGSWGSGAKVLGASLLDNTSV